MKTQTVSPVENRLSLADQQAIHQTALNYLQGWYEGDPTRMESSLHETLAKRSVTRDEAGQEGLWNLTKAEMVQYTADGGGKAAPRTELVYEVTIQDSFGDVAAVRVIARDFVDFLHLARINGTWKIVNALWAHR
jgi:hypothetical protein